MKINDSRHPWNRLTAAVRLRADDRATGAPYGFAVRVAALAMTQERKVASLFERFAFRAVGAACLLALLSVGANYSMLGTGVSISEEDLSEDDPVAVLLDA